VASAAEIKTQNRSSPFRELCQKKEVPLRKMFPQPTNCHKIAVEMHQHPELKDQIIIRYLDQAKNLVLQVPSNQKFFTERGIAREFQQATKLHASRAAAESEGEKAHGD
jgi:hypothetical protein